MRKSLSRVAVIIAGLLVLGSGVILRADVPQLKFRGYTNDFAGVMSSEAVARADALAAEVERKTGAQMAVVIVNSLGGDPAEDYANTLARRWGIGKKDNRGVLLLLAVQDRRDRIEVGYGLEPILPDGKVGGILRLMRSYLQQRNYDAAVLAALDQMAGAIAQEAGVTLGTPRLRMPPPAQYERTSLPKWQIVVIAIVFLLLLLGGGVSPLLAFLLGWGGRGGFGGGGGSWGGGSGGGGGFSGFGGGDFGGGGASSDW